MRRIVEILKSQYVLGAVVGALFAALGTYFWERPRLQIFVEDVSIASEVPEGVQGTEIISVPSKIPELTRSSDWAPAFREQTSTVGAFFKWAVETELILEEALEDRTNFLKIYPELFSLAKRAATEPEYSKFFDLFELNDAYAYGVLRGEFARGAFSIPSEFIENGDYNYSFSTGGSIVEGFRLVRRSIDEYPAIGVSKVGGAFVSFLMPTEPPSSEPDEFDLNHFVATSLATFHRPSIEKILAAIREDAKDTSDDKELIEIIRSAKSDYGYLSAVVTFHNNGTAPLSISPFFTVTINTLGKAGFPERVEIDMISLDTNGRPSPINLEGGSAISKAIVTEKPLSKLARKLKVSGQEIQELLEDGNKPAKIRARFQPVLKLYSSSGILEFSDASQEFDFSFISR